MITLCEVQLVRGSLFKNQILANMSFRTNEVRRSDKSNCAFPDAGRVRFLLAPVRFLKKAYVNSKKFVP